MKSANRWVIMGLIAAAGQLAGCSGSAGNSGNNGHSKIAPAEVLEVASGSEIPHVTLTESAMKRIDVQTDVVNEKPSPRNKSPQKAVPYSAVLYDTHGKTWVYTSPKPNLFVRQEVEVDFIQESIAYLTKGPDVGTKVANVGVAELYGTETKFGN